ncbi:MAG: oligosaccharide flippase family protein [Lachnospiraceae bacterium]|nr:oligosaccharide flippase family protein [Lachnospiraceae bacterium]
MSEASKNKQVIINIIASLVSCLVSTGISFVLSPIIIAETGAQGGGYLELATQFVNYAAIAATALNSMGGRFITIKLHQKDEQGANEYFNSILYCNIGIVAFLAIPVFFVVHYLDRLINIDPTLTSDVKLLFAANFVNFMVTIISTTFSTATFATNRLDLTALRTIESQILRAALLVLAFWLLPVKMYYMGLATLAASVYLWLFYMHYTKKLLPQIKISRSYFNLRRIIEILSAGIWNTVMRTGQVLTNYLDSLIANKMIGRSEFGYVGTSKEVITAINALYEAVSAVFTPSLTISFAKDNKDELVADLNSAMKVTGFFANIPLAFMIAFGLDFYALWLRTLTPEEVHTIYLLSILAMFGTIVGGAISPLFNVYTVVNKLKWNSFVTLFMGILSVGIVVSLLLVMPDRSKYGPYVIVGTSTVLGIIKNMTFTPMYAAHCLNLKKRSFYPVILRYIAVSAAMIGIFCGIHQIMPATGWMMLLACVIVCGIVGAALNFFLLFGKRERLLLADFLAKRLRRS